MENEKSNPKPDVAIALRYNQQEDIAPKVIATGHGVVAQKIAETARDHGIPIQENPEVAELLSGLEIGQAVPPELYGVIAEVLAFVFALDKKRNKRQNIS